MKKWYPELFNSSLNQPNDFNDLTTSVDSEGKKSVISWFSLKLLSTQNQQEDVDSDIEINTSTSTSSMKKYNSKKKFGRKKYSFCCFPIFSCLSWPQLSFKQILRYFSNIIGKNSEEFGKIPFRCFFGSIALSLYYVLFVFYPIHSHFLFPSSSLQSSPTNLSTDSSTFYKTNRLFYLNISDNYF